MYQFIHIETYSKVSAKKKLEKSYNKETKGRNVAEVIAEATREPDFCEHVTLVRPAEPPILLYGVEPEQLIELTDNYFNNTKLINNKGISRGLRKDSHVLLAGIISLNREIEDIWNDYKKDAITWLKAKYGDKLKCVIEHTDEENPHLHFYCVQDPGASFDLLHEGKKAFSEVGGKLKYKKEIAFKSAMRDFQESFYNEVSIKHGLLKTGPRLQRLTNKEYKARREQILLINQHRKNIENEIKEKVTRSERKLKNIDKIIDNTKRNETIKIIKDFNDSNFFNKYIFSAKYNNKIFNENIELKEKLIKSEKRKNTVLNNMNKIKEENIILNNKVKDFEYYKKLNMFLFNLDENLQPITINENKVEDKNNDTRNREFINREIELIAQQQQQIDQRFNSISRKQRETKFRFTEARERLSRVRDILFSNFKHTLRDLFSIDYFKRKFEEKRNKEIKTIEKIESQNRLTRESPKHGFKRKIKDF